MKSVFLCALSILIPLATIAGTIDVDFDTLIPSPQELTPAGDPVSLQPFQILIGESNEAKIGAEEINQRIESLGGKALLVTKISDDGELPGGNLIILTTGDAVRSAPIKASPAKEQGYVIYPEIREDGSIRLWLVGHDPLGTLYAAITTRQLIQISEKAIQLRPATIF